MVTTGGRNKILLLSCTTASLFENSYACSQIRCNASFSLKNLCDQLYVLYAYIFVRAPMVNIKCCIIAQKLSLKRGMKSYNLKS